MTSRDFCYFLQGFIEINNENKGLTPEQLDMVARHLALVFKHEIDPSIDGGDPKKIEVLNQIHGSRPPVGQPGQVYRC